MKGIKINASNEALFLKVALIINVSVIKLPKIKMEGFVFYRVVGPYRQQDLFNLGIVYGRLLPGNSPMPF